MVRAFYPFVDIILKLVKNAAIHVPFANSPYGFSSLIGS